MSFLSVLNLKGISVLECLENITPYSLPRVTTPASLKCFDSAACTGSQCLQKERLRQQLREKVVKAKVLTETGTFSNELLEVGGGNCVLSLSPIAS